MVSCDVEYLIGVVKNGKINYCNDYGETNWLAEGKYRAWLSSDMGNLLTKEVYLGSRIIKFFIGRIG